MDEAGLAITVRAEWWVRTVHYTILLLCILKIKYVYTHKKKIVKSKCYDLGDFQRPRLVKFKLDSCRGGNIARVKVLARPEVRGAIY